MSGHTPGPWTITGRKERDLLFAEIVSEGAGLMVAEVRGATFIDGEEHPEHVANGRVIAAAPDGLKLAYAVLEMLVANADVGASLSPTERHVMEMTEAFIAKATGAK